ncbi:hypothetical protein ABIA39_008307 [Nocardia sp. GAS34]|uniref:transposase n=1 Tax=unclassified Nocardia TaxID=2637762 RepID=UPI003D2345D9
MLAETIKAVHAASRGCHGVRRIHAELTIGMGIEVGSGQVHSVMKSIGVRGLSGNSMSRTRRHHGRSAWRRLRTVASSAFNAGDSVGHRQYFGCPGSSPWLPCGGEPAEICAFVFTSEYSSRALANLAAGFAGGANAGSPQQNPAV